MEANETSEESNVAEDGNPEWTALCKADDEVGVGWRLAGIGVGLALLIVAFIGGTLIFIAKIAGFSVIVYSTASLIVRYFVDYLDHWNTMPFIHLRDFLKLQSSASVKAVAAKFGFTG